jgi:alcohol dehydrogenase (cytochrome c)
MTKKESRYSICAALLAGTVLSAAAPALAAEVTPDRLVNANREPQNWLMNHRTYDGQRFSPLARINRDNVKNLKLAYAVPLGGSFGNGWLEATPLAENGFLFITDAMGVLYKIDATAGDAGRIVWAMDPKQERPGTNRGAALWGNLVLSPANYPPRIVATDKDSGKVVWETNLTDGQPEVRLTAAPLPIKDRLIVGASGGDSGVRDWIAGPDLATGKLAWRHHSGARRARQRDLEEHPTIPGRPAAAPCGSPGPMIPIPTRRYGGQATRCRCSIPATARATTFTPTAPFPGTPRPGT